ncbi:MAG: G8 domain-containing protein, partial [Bacteroidota bacterium]
MLSKRWIILLLALILIVIGRLPAQNANDFIFPATSPLSLLPPDQATYTVQNSGNWTDKNTWQGEILPTDLAKVYIPNGKTLTIDGDIATRIKIIRNDGKLRFSPTTNTTLRVETIIQDMMGELEIGTADTPIPQGTMCKIILIDEGDLTLMSDQWEKGLVLMGKTVMYGAQKTSWSRVAQNPPQGATSLSMQVAPQGWEVGDRIVITGTDAVDATSDEVAEIQSISGKTITLRQPLTKKRTAPAADLYVHIANLSRNILIESESTVDTLDRGHLMFMHSQNVDMNYVKLHKMGRTRKDIPIDDWQVGEGVFEANGLARKNIRGRYSLHFHRGGVKPELSPAYVRGCVVEDDPGWAYASHSSYVHFDNNVSYNVIGGGFQTESGDELGSFTNNIAIRTVNPEYPIRREAPLNAPDMREASQDFAFQGDGFWIHGGGVSLSGNVASGCSGHGFIYWPEGLIEPGPLVEPFRNTFKPANLGLSPDIAIYENALATGWVNIAGFNNNEAYSVGIGLATYYLHTTFFGDERDYTPEYISTVHSTLEDFTAWNIDRQGVQFNFTERVTLKNVRLVNNDGDATSTGIWA